MPPVCTHGPRAPLLNMGNPSAFWAGGKACCLMSVQEGWCENGGDHQPLPQAPGQTGCSGVHGMCRAGAGWEAALTLKTHHFCIIEVLEFQRWLTTVERVAFFFWAKGTHLLNTFYVPVPLWKDKNIRYCWRIENYHVCVSTLSRIIH